MTRLLADLNHNENVVFSKHYTGYSHATWLVGTVTEWIEDLKLLVEKYNPLSEKIVLVPARRAEMRFLSYRSIATSSQITNKYTNLIDPDICSIVQVASARFWMACVSLTHVFIVQ